jgi:hypothetical protein
MKILKLAIIIPLIMVGLESKAMAAMIAFTHQGSGSGTLNGVPFNSSNFSILAEGDTDNRLSLSFDVGFSIDHTSASISIAGLGDFQFLTPTRTFVNNVSSSVGFSRGGVSGGDLFNGPTQGTLSNWNMLTSIGPLNGTGQLLQGGGLFGSINTSAGILAFDNSGSPATFKAEVVPEPDSILSLLTLGGIGITSALKRRLKQSQPTKKEIEKVA